MGTVDDMSSAASSSRLRSLDQFRGYTVAAMFLVNFLGAYSATPAILRHHNTWCSYADTVMPQFFFAVGMSLRLVMSREAEKHGTRAARGRALKRGLLLMLIGLFWYQPGRDYESWGRMLSTPWTLLLREGFLTSVFQALTHIGATTIWLAPIVLASAKWRLLFALASAALHLLLSHLFWYETLHAWHVIDGGPLGFLTWTLPVIAGTLAYDAVQTAGPRGITRLLLGSLPLMLSGYALACLTQGGHWAAPPFVAPWHPADLWTMSQRAGSASYLLFASGFSLAVYALFHWWSDRRGGSLRLFTDLGLNALAAYLIHNVIMGSIGHFGPKDSPLWWASLLTAAGILFSWVATRWLNQRGLFLRL